MWMIYRVSKTKRRERGRENESSAERAGGRTAAPGSIGNRAQQTPLASSDKTETDRIDANDAGAHTAEKAREGVGGRGRESGEAGERESKRSRPPPTRDLHQSEPEEIAEQKLQLSEALAVT